MHLIVINMLVCLLGDENQPMQTLGRCWVPSCHPDFISIYSKTCFASRVALAGWNSVMIVHDCNKVLHASLQHCGVLMERYSDMQFNTHVKTLYEYFWKCCVVNVCVVRMPSKQLLKGK